MNESLKLDQTMQTVQRLSPRQVQFVRLLEMTAPEIEEEVQRQLDDNPALEVVEPTDGTDTPDVVVDTMPEGADPDDDPADYYTYRRGTDETFTPQVADDSPDLYATLMGQLGQTELPDTDRAIATYIVGNIDENGYLSRSLASMADDLSISTGLDITYEMMLPAFRAVRAMEPAGVGAVDLRDCLLLQLDRRTRPTDSERLAREIVADCFDLLSKKHYERLQSQLGIKDTERLRLALNIIHQLNPKPGSSIAASDRLLKEGQITPDVAVEVTDDDRFVVSLASHLPQLQIERTFSTHETAPANKREREAQAFIRLKRDDAEAFIAAIRQRGNTLLAVTEAIVKKQRDFFLTGDKSLLRPMILKDVAADTGFDLSVVSRATAGKYVATDQGVYPLKMFFNEAPTESADTSNHHLMHLMRDIIDAEDKRHPLSDQDILAAMKAHGHEMARRTVTKYREKLGIPVARLRKSL